MQGATVIRTERDDAFSKLFFADLSYFMYAKTRECRYGHGRGGIERKEGGNYDEEDGRERPH